MGEIALSVAVSVLVVTVVSWIVLTVAVVGGRLWYDARFERSADPLSRRRARRLVRRAGRPVRTDWGRWRRASALTKLARARHRAAPRLLRRALDDPDPTVALAAVRGLGELGDEWALDQLFRALREGRVPRSRIASHLEHLAPLPSARLLELLLHDDPAVRFWGATLLASYPTIGTASLVTLTRDEDPNVRAAAAETLGDRPSPASAAAVLRLLHDPAWFVRVHAARSAARLAGPSAAPALTHLLADARWWVRTAAKDALRSLGQGAVPALVPVLGSPDRFARNGAAEVLQDIGLVDRLAIEEPASPLLERIYAAGGQRLREAAELRAATRARADEEAEAA